jgi:hypothetical protein
MVPLKSHLQLVIELHERDCPLISETDEVVVLQLQ